MYIDLALRPLGVSADLKSAGMPVIGSEINNLCHNFYFKIVKAE